MYRSSRPDADNVEIGKYAASVDRGLQYMGSPDFEPGDSTYQQAVQKAEQILGRRLERTDITRKEYQKRLQEEWYSNYMQALHNLYDMRRIKPEGEHFERLMIHYNDRPETQ